MATTASPTMHATTMQPISQPRSLIGHPSVTQHGHGALSGEVTRYRGREFFRQRFVSETPPDSSPTSVQSCDLRRCSALGGTRTPNLLIRSRGHGVFHMLHG